MCPQLFKTGLINFYPFFVLTTLIVQVVLELTMQPRMTLNSQLSASISCVSGLQVYTTVPGLQGASDQTQDFMHATK